MLLFFFIVFVFLFSQVVLTIPSDSNLYLDDHEQSNFNSVEGFPLLDLDFVPSSDEFLLSSADLYLNDNVYETSEARVFLFPP